MADPVLVDRLAALPTFAGIPREELAWLVAHGSLQSMDPGEVIALPGDRVEHLYIILSGHVVIRVDRGAGPRRVMEWRAGDVTGKLPYSRMGAASGRTFVEAPSEVLIVEPEHFHAMIHQCPVFTAHCVHIMLDRARSFNTSDLQDDKMISLGRLAAGLAHELNNPASATARGAKLLRARLADANSASGALSAAVLTEPQRETIKRLWAACQGRTDAVLSPMQQADREDEIADWLERHGSDPQHAGPLAQTPVTMEALDALAGALPGESLDAALGWIAASCSIDALVLDIESAATRIYDLVAAVKRFTYMDTLAGAEGVDVVAGLRDTARVVRSKAESKGIEITLDVEEDLPPVQALGGDLNQVWLNLIDNALDAAPESGHVGISARQELDRVVVRITDDGAGIPEDILPRIFDPFFTTKPPGQGTGLGLPAVRQLVRSARGDVSVESRPGRTEFRVSLVV